MEELDPNQVIPHYLVVKNADKYLYRNGLSFTPISDEKRRNLLFKPIVLFTTFLISSIKSFVQIFTPDNSYLIVILADHTRFLNIGQTVNIATLFTFII